MICMGSKKQNNHFTGLYWIKLAAPRRLATTRDSALFPNGSRCSGFVFSPKRAESRAHAAVIAFVALSAIQKRNIHGLSDGGRLV